MAGRRQLIWSRPPEPIAHEGFTPGVKTVPPSSSSAAAPCMIASPRRTFHTVQPQRPPCFVLFRQHPNTGAAGEEGSFCRASLHRGISRSALITALYVRSTDVPWAPSTGCACVLEAGCAANPCPPSIQRAQPSGGLRACCHRWHPTSVVSQSALRPAGRVCSACGRLLERRAPTVLLAGRQRSGCLHVSEAAVLLHQPWR